MLIGVTGKKRRGKGTVSDRLIEAFRFNGHGFADKLKEVAYATNPIIYIPDTIADGYSMEQLSALHMLGNVTDNDPIDGVEDSEHGALYRLQNVVDVLGWELAKEIPEVRYLLQRIGTEGGRKVFGENFWIDKLFEELEQRYEVYNSGFNAKGLQSNIVITDLRFDNEAQRVKEYGGIIVEVRSKRPGLPAEDSHESENGVSVDLIDYYLNNDTTVSDLQHGVDQMISHLKGIETS